jgi:hypothetical protein
VKFVSQNVKKIYDQLPVTCKKQLIENKECECMLKGLRYHLKLETVGNVISNVGLKVFKDTVNSFNCNSINSFVEREFLKFILDDNVARESRRKEDHVYIYYANSFQEFSLLKTPESISKVISDISGITIKQDSLKYNVVITNSRGEKIGMEFPAINSLISSMDKKELDEYISTDLLKDIPINPNPDQRQLNHTFNSEGDLLVSEGEHFIIEDFTSYKYYKREKDTIKLVFNKKYISESLSNLFLAGEPTNHRILIDLKIKGYGNTDKNKLMGIDKLLTHFDSQFKFYFGIEDTCNDHLRGTLLIYNSSLNYLHLIDIKTDAESLFKDPGHLVGSFYPYIPTHNIKDLFGKGDSKKSILLEDILNGNSYE